MFVSLIRMASIRTCLRNFSDSVVGTSLAVQAEMSGYHSMICRTTWQENSRNGLNISPELLVGKVPWWKNCRMLRAEAKRQSRTSNIGKLQCDAKERKPSWR